MRETSPTPTSDSKLSSGHIYSKLTGRFVECNLELFLRAPKLFFCIASELVFSDILGGWAKYKRLLLIVKFVRSAIQCQNHFYDHKRSVQKTGFFKATEFNFWGCWMSSAHADARCSRHPRWRHRGGHRDVQFAQRAILHTRDADPL